MPLLKDKIENTEIPADVNSVYEIVINGFDEESIKVSMRAGIKFAITVPVIKKISTGNYGGKLGKYQFKLHDLF